jgi:hypothetical protein
MTRRIAHAAPIVALVLAFAIAPAAFASKGGAGGKRSGGGGSSSFSLVLMDGATQPTYGGRITFNVSTTATDRPYVGLRCWQGSTLVGDGYVGYFPSYPFDPWFTLSSLPWAPDLEASCTARLFYFGRRGRENVLKTMTFLVAP